MASTYLTRTQTAGNRRTFTISWWIKRSGLTAGSQMIGSDPDGSAGNNFAILDLKSTDALDFSGYEGGHTFRLITDRLFRDTSAWYHIVFSVDTTQATASNRMKIYVNGVQETSFSTETYPSQNYETSFNNNSYVCHIGGRSGAYVNGSMSHIHFIDGTAYDATAFGQYDANGVWKINTSPSVTYGTNGFFILKDGNSVTDQSGNSNNLTVGAGTLTKTEDNPSNVFANWNVLDNIYFAGNFSNGNTTLQSSSSNYAHCTTTLGMSSGKFYSEHKWTSGSNMRLGLVGKIATSNTDGLNGGTDEIYYDGNNGKFDTNGTSTTSWGSTYAVNDIIGIAYDGDNNKIYFSKNGVWQNSANPSNGTNGMAIPASSTTNQGFYFFSWSDNSSSSSSTIQANFGNGYFGTTAVASAGTNASGNRNI